MLTVTPHKKKKNHLWILLVVSAFLHFGFYSYSSEFFQQAAKKYLPIHVVLDKKEKPPAPKPEKVEKPKPPKPKPKPPKPKPKEPPPPPKPNKETPPPPEPPKEPPKEIFGVTEDSVSKQGSGVAVRVGNTLNKDMELKYSDPKDIKPLPKAPPRRRPVPAYKLSKLPSFKDRADPVYPAEARRNEIEGVVKLEVIIDETGRVLKVRVKKSLGYGCDEAAIAAVRQSKFNPGYQGDKPVLVKLTIPFRFVLED